MNPYQQRLAPNTQQKIASLRDWGKAFPWAWPRDGRRETLEGAGVALAQQYKAQGLNMLHTYAQFEDGSVSVEADTLRTHDAALCLNREAGLSVAQIGSWSDMIETIG